MSYFLLRDTFGRGLETIPGIDLELVEEHQLVDHICDATDIFLGEVGYDSLKDYEEDWDEGANPMGQILVICKVVEEIKGKNADTYISDALRQREEERNKEEYELYLKLKEKFEK